LKVSGVRSLKVSGVRFQAKAGVRCQVSGVRKEALTPRIVWQQDRRHESLLG